MAARPATLPRPARSEPAAAPGTLARNPALDGVRAFAVLGVIAFHLAADLAPGGFLGVSVFFVLSGYLITHLLLAERRATGRIDLRAFYMRRALRLFPALVVAVALAAVLALTSGVSPGDVGVGSVMSLLYVTDFTAAAGLSTGFLGHTWSLGVEEQFYLLWPLVLIAIVAHRPAGLTRAALAIVIAAVVLTAVLAPALGRAGYFLPWTHVCGLLLGAAYAAHIATGASAPGRLAPLAAVLAAGALAIAAVTVPGPFWTPLYYGGWLAVSLLALALVAVAGGGRRTFVGRALAARPLVWLGVRSYGIYLFSLPITLAVEHHMPAGLAVRAVVIFVATVGLAATSFHFVERPFLRRKQRHQPLLAGGEARY